MKRVYKYEWVYVVVVVWAVIYFSFGMIAAAHADCFDKYYQSTVKTVRARKTVIRGNLGCRTFECLTQKTPRSQSTLTVYITRAMRPQVHWGNLGWATPNVAVVRNRAQIKTAMKLARGVELSSLGNSTLIAGDRDFHDRFAAEMRCLRRKGQSVESFGETAYLD
jgi:hypothetical protein